MSCEIAVHLRNKLHRKRRAVKRIEDCHDDYSSVAERGATRPPLFLLMLLVT
jgi:hypothetical protein